VCGVPEGQEQELLLLLDLMDKRLGKRLTDMGAPVTDALGSGGRWVTPPTLVAYRYPSREAGPKSAAGQEVVVFHR